MKPQYAYLVSFLFCGAGAYVGAEVYKVGGEKSRTLIYMLGLMGFTSMAIFYHFQRKWTEKWEARKKGGGDAAAGGGGDAAAGGSGGDGGSGEVDSMVKEAATKLVSSKLGPNASLSSLPLIFVTGDQNSTKTTVMVHSGMEPELLSGQLYQQDNVIVPTRVTNFWYAKKAVFAEAGAPVWGSGESWTRLLKKLAPPKLKSIFGRAQTAPRAVILCVDAERFLQPGASEAMTTSARGVQARLNEISSTFGINFPVYVMFTRSDRFPFFLDFVRNLSSEEATQVFGVTLPMRAAKGGVYAEEETQRLNAMFNELFYSLCDKRIEYLPRENDAEKLPGCYEFPREFRKLRAGMVQFLVDVGRPSQLQTGPFLRGFYFTGVRPVIISDVAANPIFQERKSAFDPTGGATRMFKMSEFQQPQMPVAQQQQGGRKVPQWVFLNHFFNDIVLEDKAALGASEASAKASGLQRVMLIAASIFAVLWSIGMTVSFFKNNALENRIIEAARQLNAVKLSGVPTEDDLKKLAGLRAELAQLTKWNKDGPPLSYRFGLYAGDNLYRPTRKAYYNGFNQLLFRDTQVSRILTGLQGLNPGAQQAQERCGYVYEGLRAYLITTSQWPRAAPTFEQENLRGTLHARWSEGREAEIGDARMKAASEEFAFYAGDLPNSNPFSDREDGPGVDKARIYQSNCSGFEAIYNRLIGEASAANKTVNYNAMFPWTGQVVRNNLDIKGAYSKTGWDWMTKRLVKADNLTGEEWVLGPVDKYPRSNVNRATIVADLWTRYSTDFISRWREYFNKNTFVQGYASPADAASKLKIHSDTRAPILYLIGLASQNTAVEPAGTPYAKQVRDAFLWSHTVVAPGNDYVLPNNRPYINGLQGLQISVEAAAQSPNDAGLVQGAQSKKLEALQYTAQVATFSRADIEGKLDVTIKDIMEKPIKAFSMDPPSVFTKFNPAAGAMCQEFNVLTRKFPFDPTKQPELSVAELNSILQPPTGKFWQFYETSGLKEFLTKDGNPLPTPSGKFNPAFLEFFKRVVDLSNALYRGGTEPRLAYSVQLTGVRLVLNNSQAKSGSIAIDGKAAKLGGPAVSSVWTGSPGHSVEFEYNDQVSFIRPDSALPEQRLWGVFRFFVDAQVSGSGGRYTMVWPVKGGNEQRLIAEANFIVDLSGAPAVFDKRFLSNLRCVPTVGK